MGKWSCPPYPDGGLLSPLLDVVLLPPTQGEGFHGSLGSSDWVGEKNRESASGPRPPPSTGSPVFLVQPLPYPLPISQPLAAFELGSGLLKGD